MVVIKYNVRGVIVLCARHLSMPYHSIVAIQNVVVLLLSLIRWFPVSLYICCLRIVVSFFCAL